VVRTPSPAGSSYPQTTRSYGPLPAIYPRVGERPELDVGRNHFEQASRAFDRGDWEAANAQLRSAFDAVYDVLANLHGCPPAKTAGKARQWLQAEGLLEPGEADPLRTFMVFAGRAGSHAGLSARRLATPEAFRHGSDRLRRSRSWVSLTSRYADGHRSRCA
jgi:hypothetical protein